MHLRDATPRDTDAILDLLGAYMAETFGATFHGERAAFVRDAFGHRFSVQVACAGAEGLLGFLAWVWTYDLHHCVRGACVMDLYVRPEARTQGVATRLLAHTAALTASQGGLFLTGQAVEDPRVQHLYDKLAVRFPGTQCTLSGRAFRALGDLDGHTADHIFENLPDKAWNKEA